MSSSECVVCMEPFDNDQHRICNFDCGHVICLACADMQVKAGFCPNCRKPVHKYVKIFVDIGTAKTSEPLPPAAKPKTQLRIGRLPKGAMLQFKQEFLPSLMTAKLITSANTMISNIEPHASIRFMTCVLSFKSKEDALQTKADLQQAIFQYRSTFFGIADVEKYTPEDSLSRVHYDLLMAAEGMPAEPQLLFIDYVQPWYQQYIQANIDYIEKYYGSMMGVRAEAITTRKPGVGFPVGQIFLEVASELVKDKLLQELLDDGVHLNKTVIEAIKEHKEYREEGNFMVASSEQKMLFRGGKGKR